MANRGGARPGHVVISKSFLGHFPLRIGTVPVLRYFLVVRKTPHGVETRQHSREAFGTPAFGGGFFLTHHWARTNTDAASFRANQREATVSHAFRASFRLPAVRNQADRRLEPSHSEHGRAGQRAPAP